MRSKKGKEILAFRGLPYAKPPVGDLRFRRSEPAEAWTGVLDGTRESQKCLQPNVLMPTLPLLEGGEDCLYLNVYTKQPVTGGSSLLPVLVYLHGGAFVVGSCEAMLYGPQILLDRELVLVALNYRYCIYCTTVQQLYCTTVQQLYCITVQQLCCTTVH